MPKKELNNKRGDICGGCLEDCSCLDFDGDGDVECWEKTTFIGLVTVGLLLLATGGSAAGIAATGGDPMAAFNPAQTPSPQSQPEQ